MSVTHINQLHSTAGHHSALSAPAGPGQDPADHLPAGLPARVPGYLRAPHGHRAQVHPAQLDERVQEVVPCPAHRQVPRQPRAKGERCCLVHASDH